MGSPQTTYCNHQFLDEVIANKKTSESHKIAYSILDKLSDIVIDLSKEDILDIAKTNPIYKHLIKRVNRSVIPKQDWKSECDFTDVGDDMFFIAPNYIKDYKELRKKYGCLIVSSDSDIHILYRMNRPRPYSLITDTGKKAMQGEEFEDINSWEEVMASIKIEPINSAIVIDNFMFTEKFESRKEFSLYSILKSIIPSTLEIPFDLTILANNTNGTLSEEYLNTIKSEIENLAICDNLNVSIIAHTKTHTTHDREILTNYHYLYSGVGFSVIDKDGIKEIAKGVIHSTIHSVDNICGVDTHKHSHNRAIAWAKKIIEKQENHKSFVVGNKENRLFK